ncbi:hypothetical protein [Mesorhizobium japonicum]|uniref:hypothetical protein n=1 Tax=Mesorhizobium japonicum TaxID=2066070 RepID=UPI003B5CBA1A
MNFAASMQIFWRLQSGSATQAIDSLTQSGFRVIEFEGSRIIDRVDLFAEFDRAIGYDHMITRWDAFEDLYRDADSLDLTRTSFEQFPAGYAFVFLDAEKMQLAAQEEQLLFLAFEDVARYWSIPVDADPIDSHPSLPVVVIFSGDSSSAKWPWWSQLPEWSVDGGGRS